MSIRASLVSFFLRQTIRKQFEKMDIEKLRNQNSGFGGKLPDELVTETVNAGGVAAEWVLWPGAVEDAVILYFHGGGYVFGNPDSHRNLAWRLAKATGARVLVVDYRLAPDNPFPAAVDDARTAYQWLLDQGYATHRIVVAGDSAGGGLSAALMVELRNQGIALPAAASLISPWVDLALTGKSVTTNAAKDVMLSPVTLEKFAALYLGDRDARAPLASPIYADLTGLPPVQVLVGSTEVLYSDSERLVERIKAAGGEASLSVWPKMPHVFPILAGLIPEAQQAIEEIAAFIRRALGTSSLE